MFNPSTPFIHSLAIYFIHPPSIQQSFQALNKITGIIIEIKNLSSKLSVAKAYIIQTYSHMYVQIESDAAYASTYTTIAQSFMKHLVLVPILTSSIIW